MGVRKTQGMTYHSYNPFNSSGSIPNALNYTQGLYDDMGLDFDYGFDTPSEYTRFDQDQIRENLYLDQREGYAEDMFQLFDQYRPQLEHIADNAGVSGAELSNALADSGARYNANYDAMMAESNRALQRMGVNPNSGRYAAMTTGNALTKTAGYSANQNQVQQMARQQDMNERMQAAQLGLGIGSQGANMYNQMGAQMQSAQQFYDQMGEQARQFNASGKLQANNQQLQMQNQIFNQAQQRWDNGLHMSYRTNPLTGASEHEEYSYGF
ncbi:hypothetical protein [Salinisphaera sp. G21_0]|uniref:hypothetical protein n=1 Tax=Salinisphaera sp. G21_0 TaxID=2821094 RepID=UPI001ADAFDB0|nr:hypothetical protein [Salinisphaera sp. G21_0]MBO9483804.1 hypothetical protein [Salinisphaera sp. G21_0]